MYNTLETTQSRKYRMRWWTLLVLSVSLVIIVIDSTIVNVALPTLQRELDASASSLQWIVNSYILVFAALLLTMGSLGDRFGRKRVLQAGLVLFGLSSLLAAYAQTSEQLIAARAIMGVGGALIMPSTLSIIIDVFPREERGKAIGIWTGVASLGVPIGPVVGGLLLEHFSWGAIFFINLPIVLLALSVGFFLVPESRDPVARKIDIPGVVLSTGALSILIYAIIEAPTLGWLDPIVLVTFVGALALGGAFVVHERRTDHPMLDIHLFMDRRFSSGAGAITVAFLALVGTTFTLTQYLQFVRGYTPFEAGLRVMPISLGFMIGGINSSRVVSGLGTRWAIAGGLSVVSATLVAISFFEAETAYWMIGPALLTLGVGMGSTMAPATEAVMSAVPEAKAGVGSAVNDTTRQGGAVLGVGILGSLLNWIYSSNIADAVAGLSAEAAAAAQNSVGSAAQIAANTGGPAGDALRAAAYTAFVDAFSVAVLVGAGFAFAGALLVLRLMPTRLFTADGQVSEPAGQLGESISPGRATLQEVPAHGDD